MSEFICNYKKIKKMKIPGFGYPLNKVKDFSIYNKSRPDLNPFLKRKSTISEKAFIIDLTGYTHFHFIFDKLAQYEFIKRLDPEINLYVLTDEHHTKEKNGILKDLTSVYSIPESNVFNVASGEKYVFKNLFFIWSTHNYLFTNIFVKEFFDPWHNKKDFKVYIQTIYPLLQSRFKGYIKSKIDPDLKIFISRFNHHEQKGRNKDDFRYISKNDEIELEKFFKYKGYQIIAAEDLGLLEQVELYSGAYKIAGIKSSGLVNTIFCKKESEIIAINLDDEYQVWYDYICMFAGIKYSEFPTIYDEKGRALSYALPRETHNRKTFSFKEIEESLLKNSTLL
jgi:hypothetical protein